MSKELLTFPCDFPIKIFSKSDFELEDFATNIIHKHAPKMEFIPTKSSTSSKGNYQSITVVIKATSKEQIDSIYKDLTANKNIIMVL